MMISEAAWQAMIAKDLDQQQRIEQLERENKRLTGNEVEQECVWYPDDVSDENPNYWQGSCGYDFRFDADGPVDNGFKHCPNCGGKVKTGGEDD